MRHVDLSLPQIGLIAGTRGMLGAGIGLLLADRLSREQRQAVGWTLLAVGALTTIPLVAQVIHGDKPSTHNGRFKKPEQETVEAQL